MENQTKILIVEDEVLLAQLMVMQLETIGYNRVATVPTGELAINEVKENSPDLILMDIRLAGEIDGIEAASVIQSKSKIPIVFITGYADPTTKKRADKVKPLAFLLKPLDIGKLKEILDSYFAMQEQ